MNVPDEPAGAVDGDRGSDMTAADLGLAEVRRRRRTAPGDAGTEPVPDGTEPGGPEGRLAEPVSGDAAEGASAPGPEPVGARPGSGEPAARGGGPGADGPAPTSDEEADDGTGGRPGGVAASTGPVGTALDGREPVTDSAGHGDGRTAPADGPGRAGTGSRTGSDGTDRDPDLSEPAPGGLGSAGADLPSASGGPGRALDFAGPAGAESGDRGPGPDSAEAAGGTADEGAPAGDGFPAEASADGSAAAAADAGPPERTAGEGPAGGRRRAADGESGRPRRRPPAGSRPFFGRERELKALHGDIERAGLNTLSGRKEPRARVLLIAGRPGSGRTALADELAARLAHAYPDGVVRARLTEAGGEAVPTERTAREILTFFALPTPPGAGEDELCERVRAALAARRVLLLLDDAGDAGQVDPLVPDNPDCLVVAVATGPLTGIPDVRPCTIGGMDTKAAIALLERLAGEVRITVDPQAAESLAEECAGQPAALVLAGGWLAARPTTSVADAAKRLRAQPQSQDSPVGDRPLARAFRLVYESLPPSSARFLRLLALAPAGRVDAHTASALAGCSVSDAMVLLKDLAALGLLRASGVRAAAHHGAHDDQYLVPGALMPPLRALLEEKDRPAEMQLARARMLERTVRLLQSCRSVTEPEGSPARAKLATLPRTLRFPHAAAAEAWLGAHLPALLASARLAVADGELDTLARRLIAALVRALTAHHGAEAAAPELYGLHRLVLDIAERRELHRERAAALLNLGDLDARTGRTRDALARYRAALDAGRAANDLYATGRAMESVGGAHQDLQDWQRAADWYGRALSQRLSRGERADAARLYGRLGTVHTYAGRYGEALRDWRAATAEYRRIHDLPGQARALSEVARVQEYAGRPHESLRTCEEAIGWARQAGDDRLQAALRLRAADTLDRLGDSTAARLHRSAAERLLEGATAESGTRRT